jgi:hypothetical protein
MAITRAQRESIWAHIIKTVMELDANCQLVRALNRDGYTTMDLISTLNEDDIMKLEFGETPGTDATGRCNMRLFKKRRRAHD